jgi:SOS response regulatory protein OraA/RecX
VEAAILRLSTERYLDDGTYAARFARSRLAHHGLGPRRIREALRGRGVALETTEQGLREALDEVPEAEALASLARKYWRAHARDEHRQRLRKLWVFLLRRGFSPELVRRQLGALWPRHRDAVAELASLDPEIE